jgi:hypothetical protein
MFWGFNSRKIANIFGDKSRGLNLDPLFLSICSKASKISCAGVKCAVDYLISPTWH